MQTLVLCLVVLGQAAYPGPPVRQRGDAAEIRKQARDEVLKTVGDQSLEFTKRFHDLGIAVLQRCKPETARALVKLLQDGSLDRLRDPVAVLQAVQRHGEPAGAWLVSNVQRLVDPLALELWAAGTLDYVYDLRDLEADAARTNANRQVLPPLRDAKGGWNETYVAGGVIALVLLIAFLWRRRRTGPLIT